MSDKSYTQPMMLNALARSKKRPAKANIYEVYFLNNFFILITEHILISRETFVISYIKLLKYLITFVTPLHSS
jgi:hypothetical protein